MYVSVNGQWSIQSIYHGNVVGSEGEYVTMLCHIFSCLSICLFRFTFFYKHISLLRGCPWTITGLMWNHNVNILSASVFLRGSLMILGCKCPCIHFLYLNKNEVNCWWLLSIKLLPFTMKRRLLPEGRFSIINLHYVKWWVLFFIIHDPKGLGRSIKLYCLNNDYQRLMKFNGLSPRSWCYMKNIVCHHRSWC